LVGYVEVATEVNIRENCEQWSDIGKVIFNVRRLYSRILMGAYVWTLLRTCGKELLDSVFRQVELKTFHHPFNCMVRVGSRSPSIENIYQVTLIRSLIKVRLSFA